MPIRKMPSYKSQYVAIRRDLERDIENSLDVKRVIVQIKKAITLYYSETFADWGASGSDGDRSDYGVERYNDVPKVKFTPPNGKVEFLKKGVRITIATMAANENGDAHHIWYWVSDGTRNVDWNFGYPSAPFKPLNSPRTKPGTTKVGGFGGYQSEYVRVADGSTRRGIQARNFSDEIGKQSQKTLDKVKIEGFEWEASFRYIKPKLKRI